VTDAETVRVQHVFRAPPDRVYAAWVDGSLPRWMSAGQGDELVAADQHAVVGGTFDFVTRHHGALVEHVGRFLELEPPRRVVFTWGVKDRGEPVRVEVELATHGTGTQVVLSHRIDPAWTWFLSRTEPMWTAALDALDRQLEGRGAPF
jgi:uncharacterized protein YndB with AHSA1/START domain